LGNLALLLGIDNSTFKDKGFSVKKEILSTVPLELTNMVGKREDWNEKEIQERQEFMAGIAASRWPRESLK
jgi:hypothetical protein